MIIPISSITNVQNSKKYSSKNRKSSSPSFKAVKFLEVANKFRFLESDLLSETKQFIKTGSNVSSLGRGLFSEVFAFCKHKNIVIKEPFGHDTFEQEANALKAIPASMPNTQQFVARAYDDDTDKYYLLSTKVEGNSPHPRMQPWTKTTLRSLFTGMFEMDKVGLYHGDLNNGNIKINRYGEVNFLDFQWGTKTNLIHFYENNTEQIMPNFIPIQNSQMFEMAEIPYYLKQLGNSNAGKRFLNDYLNEKSIYHKNRQEHIYKTTRNWEYRNEIEYIEKAKLFEAAQEEVYRGVSEKTLNIETLKFHFLSAFREASKYLDPNTPHKNIIPSGSSYIYALSTVQALRKKISEFQNYAFGKMNDYLKCMSDFADYWYFNLKSWTKDAFYYPFRHTRAILEKWETLHDFNDPKINIEHFDDMTNVTKLVDSNFEVGYTCNFDCSARDTGHYMGEVNTYMNSTKTDYSAKNHNSYKGLVQAHERLKKAYNDKRWLDVINNSLLLMRRCEEMYYYGNCSSVQRNAACLAESVFKQVYRDVDLWGPGYNTFPGYENMNEFR